MKLFLLLLTIASCVAQGFIIDPYRFVPGVNCDSCTNNLVAYWKMDEAVSGPRTNSSPYVLGEINMNLADFDFASIGSTTGKIINASVFDGNDSDFSGGSSSFGWGTTGGSLSFWVKMSDVTTTTGILLEFASNEQWQVYWNANTWNLVVREADEAYTTLSTANLGWVNDAWHFVRVSYVFNGVAVAGTMEIQIDNGAVTSRSTRLASSTLDTGDTAQLLMGRYGPGGFFLNNAVIDEVGLWNRTLTSDEWTCLYNSGAGISCCPF